MKTLRVGTRSSALALKQTELVIEALKRVDPSVDIEVVGITDYFTTASFRRLRGGRYRVRTCDPYHVKVVLYR